MNCLLTGIKTWKIWHQSLKRTNDRVMPDWRSSQNKCHSLFMQTDENSRRIRWDRCGKKKKTRMKDSATVVVSSTVTVFSRCKENLHIIVSNYSIFRYLSHTYSPQAEVLEISTLEIAYKNLSFVICLQVDGSCKSNIKFQFLETPRSFKIIVSMLYLAKWNEGWDTWANLSVTSAPLAERLSMVRNTLSQF